MPTINYDWSRVDPDQRARVEAADAAIERVSKGSDFYEGFTIGRGVIAVQELVQSESRTDDVASYAYRSAWAAVAANYPHIKDLDKVERHRYAWMADNEDELRKWHARLSDKQRRVWNHPRTVYNHAPCGKAARPPSEKKPRQAPATKSDLTEAIGVITEEVTRAGGSLAPYDLSTPEMIEASAETCIAQYGADTARRFAEVLLRVTAPPADGSAFVTEHRAKAAAGLSDAQRAEVRSMRAAGKSYIEIGKAFDIPWQTVRRVVRAFLL
jgi:hypothetical protein